jgi:hypothetical protein
MNSTRARRLGARPRKRATRHRNTNMNVELPETTMEKVRRALDQSGINPTIITPGGAGS